MLSSYVHSPRRPARFGPAARPGAPIVGPRPNFRPALARRCTPSSSACRAPECVPWPGPAMAAGARRSAWRATDRNSHPGSLARGARAPSSRCAAHHHDNVRERMLSAQRCTQSLEGMIFSPSKFAAPAHGGVAEHGQAAAASHRFSTPRLTSPGAREHRPAPLRRVGPELRGRPAGAISRDRGDVCGGPHAIQFEFQVGQTLGSI